MFYNANLYKVGLMNSQRHGGQRSTSVTFSTPEIPGAGLLISCLHDQNNNYSQPFYLFWITETTECKSYANSWQMAIRCARIQVRHTTYIGCTWMFMTAGKYLFWVHFHSQLSTLLLNAPFDRNLANRKWNRAISSTHPWLRISIPISDAISISKYRTYRYCPLDISIFSIPIFDMGYRYFPENRYFSWSILNI